MFALLRHTSTTLEVALPRSYNRAYAWALTLLWKRSNALWQQNIAALLCMSFLLHQQQSESPAIYKAIALASPAKVNPVLNSVIESNPLNLDCRHNVSKHSERYHRMLMNNCRECPHRHFFGLPSETNMCMQDHSRLPCRDQMSAILCCFQGAFSTHKHVQAQKFKTLLKQNSLWSLDMSWLIHLSFYQVSR